MVTVFKYCILIISIIFVSCSDSYNRKVTYKATGAISAYNLQYLNENNELIEEVITPNSAQDTWQYDFLSEEGSIVYISGYYKDINSSLKILILVDGSIYKQGNSQNDTLRYLTVSGTIPY